jgi:hypothetical protein
MGSVSGPALAQDQGAYARSLPPNPPTQAQYYQGGGAVGAQDTHDLQVNAGAQWSIARRVLDAAGAFDGYMRRAAAIKADFRDGVTVARAVELGGVYEPGQLEQGAIAYAALVALQDPLFVQVVQDVARIPGARDAFAQRLTYEPSYVLQAIAARKAATRVAAVLGRMGAQLVAAGAAVNQASYDVQRQEWSKAPIEGPGERLARIKAQSAVAVSLQPDETTQLMGAIAALGPPDVVSQAEAPRTSPVVTRGLALAALVILGRAGEGDAERAAALMSDPEDAHCIKMAKLDLFQCLAVAGPHYENLFCLGRHGMMQTGQCVVSAAGALDGALAEVTGRRPLYQPVAARGRMAEEAPPPGVLAPGEAPGSEGPPGASMRP